MPNKDDMVLQRRDVPADTDVLIRSGADAGVMYRSGLTVYDEALVGGRLVGRYWSATGTIKPERHLAENWPLLDLGPVDSFALRIGDAVLDRGWRWMDAGEMPDDAVSRHAVIELSHAVHPITVRVHTCFDGSSFLIRWLDVTNMSGRPVSLSYVSPFSGLLWWIRDSTDCVADSAAVFALGYYESSAPEEEGNFVWQDLLPGTRTVGGRNGRSGHGRPSFMLRNLANGEVFIGELAWSSNWRYTITVEQFKQAHETRLFVAIGPFVPDPVWRLIDPGETVVTPRVHLGHLHVDLDGCVQALHQHIRTWVLPPQPLHRTGLIEANHRGYLIDQESEDGIKREIDIAADLGVEVFVVDAGWYGPEPNLWSQNVGDWYAGAWLPNDLYPLVEHAHRRRLLFGLWAEVESIGANSRLRQEHPDWILQRNGEPPDGAGRHLDVADPAVAEWMESEIVRLISQYKLDLFRLDYNTIIHEGGNRERDGFVENTLWRHVETIWGIFERMRQRFPDVIFESCASGGGRLDLGMLRYFHVTEITDWMLAPRSLKILNGLTLHLPPEICLQTFGTEIADHYLYGDLDLLLRTCLFGHPILRGIAPTLEEIGEPRRSRISHALSLYKSFIRPMLPEARVYHHTPILPLRGRQPWCVLEYAAPDGSREVAGIFRLTAPDCGHYRYRPRGLRAGGRYRVTLDNSGETIDMSGLELQRDGLEIRLASPLTSELLLVERG